MRIEMPLFRKRVARTRLTLLFGFVLLAACTHRGKPAADPGCAALLPTSVHYPVGALDPADGRADQFYRQWFSLHLKAMSESPVTCTEAETEYRLLWLRTFHHPVAVRVSIADDRATLRAIELDGKGGYEPGKVDREVNRSLSKAELEALMVAASKLRQIPSVERPAVLGSDGARWVLETRDRTGYRVMHRQSPQSGAIREFGLQLLSLTGWSSIGPVY